MNSLCFWWREGTKDVVEASFPLAEVAYGACKARDSPVDVEPSK